MQIVDMYELSYYIKKTKNESKNNDLEEDSLKELYKHIEKLKEKAVLLKMKIEPQYST